MFSLDYNLFLLDNRVVYTIRIKMKIKLTLFYTNLEWDSVKEILPLLQKVGSVFDLEIEKKEIKKFGEKKLKFIIL